MDHKYSTYLLLLVGGIMLVVTFAVGLDGIGSSGYLARWVNGELLNSSNVVDDGISVNVSIPLYVQGVLIDGSSGGSSPGNSTFYDASTSDVPLSTHTMVASYG